ncbi:EF-hand domain-containing protein 1 [Irineochytrium annulatum]|nr:EF-hand domain-containing protein 1 [Irineochytrium annulatum]
MTSAGIVAEIQAAVKKEFDSREKELVEREQELSKREARIKGFWTTDNTNCEQVVIRVGQRLFYTSRDVLLSQPDSYFSGLLSDKFKRKDGDEPYFVPRDADSFEEVLRFMVYGRIVSSLSDGMKYRLERDAEFYGLPALSLAVAAVGSSALTGDDGVVVLNQENQPPLVGDVLQWRLRVIDSKTYATPLLAKNLSYITIQKLNGTSALGLTPMRISLVPLPPPSTTAPTDSQPSFVRGHLGATPTQVTGIVRLAILPASPHIAASSAKLKIRLHGVARTGWFESRGPSLLNPLRNSVVEERRLLDEELVVHDCFPGNDVELVGVGTYDVPFRFSLPDILPPSFQGKEGTISYVLTATIAYKQRGLLRKTERVVKKSAKETIILRRTTTIEFESWDACADAAILTNFDKKDAIKYRIVVPKRNFGPDDPIVAHVHISQLPEGHSVEHVDINIFAEVSTRANNNVKKSRHVILWHRDHASHSGHFWSRLIHVEPRKSGASIDTHTTLTNPAASQPDLPSDQPLDLNPVPDLIDVARDPSASLPVPLENQNFDLALRHPATSLPTPGSQPVLLTRRRSSRGSAPIPPAQDPPGSNPTSPTSPSASLPTFSISAWSGDAEAVGVLGSSSDHIPDTASDSITDADASDGTPGSARRSSRSQPGFPRRRNMGAASLVRHVLPQLLAGNGAHMGKRGAFHTFVSPLISVRHVMRVEVVTRRRGPVFGLPALSERCHVETPVVLHAAGERERRFLRCYIQGPDEDQVDEWLNIAA